MTGSSSPHRLRDASRRPLAYWELAPEALCLVQEDVLEDEVYMLLDINHGRRMLAIDLDPSTSGLPTMIDDPEPSDVHDQDKLNFYSDRIAMLLSAARQNGWDPTVVVNTATRQEKFSFDELPKHAECRDFVGS